MMPADDCNEKYTELCALAATGALDEGEARELRSHASRCPQCAHALAEYEAFASGGLAKLAAELTDAKEVIAAAPSWSRQEVKEKLLAATAPLPSRRSSRRWSLALRPAAIAAGLVLAA